MDLRQLAAFLAVADLSSFTRAAQRLGTTQSSVSTAVRRLEDELDAVLLERTTHYVTLTDAGRALVPQARATLAAVTRAREVIDEVRGGLRGTVRLGVPQAQATGGLSVAAAVAALRRTHPDVHVQLRQGAADTLSELLVEGELDLAVLATSGQARRRVTLDTLRVEPMRVLCAASNPLARRDSVSLPELCALPMADMPHGWGFRTANDVLFAGAGLYRHLEHEINDLAGLIELIRHDLAVALLPASVVAADDTALAIIALAGAPHHQHHVSIASPANRPVSLAAQALTAQLHAVNADRPPAPEPPKP